MLSCGFVKAELSKSCKMIDFYLKLLLKRSPAATKLNDRLFSTEQAFLGIPFLGSFMFFLHSNMFSFGDVILGPDNVC